MMTAHMMAIKGVSVSINLFFYDLHLPKSHRTLAVLDLFMYTLLSGIY